MAVVCPPSIRMAGTTRAVMRNTGSGQTPAGCPAGTAGDAMAEAYGLYTHIRSNRRRSIALLIGLFFLVYLMVFAGALAAEAMSYDASLQCLLRKAWTIFLMAAPFATIGTALWIFIAYKFHQSLIDMVTGGHEVTRTG